VSPSGRGKERHEGEGGGETIMGRERLISSRRENLAAKVGGGINSVEVDWKNKVRERSHREKLSLHKRGDPRGGKEYYRETWALVGKDSCDYPYQGTFFSIFRKKKGGKTLRTGKGGQRKRERAVSQGY